jgi:hypothetical protein
MIDFLLQHNYKVLHNLRADGDVNTFTFHIIEAPEGRKAKNLPASFLLRFVEHMPLEAIAEAMDLETGTVKSHLHRAVEAVRDACTGRLG